MTKVVLRKRLGALHAVDDDGRELLARLKNDRDVLVEITAARNVRQHRLFFAALNLLVENGDGFTSVDDALRRVKLACGWTDEIIDGETGQVFFTLRSIAFGSMDQTAFAALFDQALKVICDRWLVGTDQEALRQEIYRLVDGPAASSLGRRAA